jgi:hypothetical protein
MVKLSVYPQEGFKGSVVFERKEVRGNEKYRFLVLMNSVKKTGGGRHPCRPRITGGTA